MKINLAICFVLVQSFVVYAPYDGFKGFDKSLLEKPIRDLTAAELALIVQRFEAQKAATNAMTPAQRRHEEAIIMEKNDDRLAKQRRQAGL